MDVKSWDGALRLFQRTYFLSVVYTRLAYESLLLFFYGLLHPLSLTYLLHSLGVPEHLSLVKILLVQVFDSLPTVFTGTQIVRVNIWYFILEFLYFDMGFNFFFERGKFRRGA